MVNYNNALIYCITLNNSEQYLYIGSTTDFKSRLYVHKHRSMNKKSEYYDDLLYEKIRDYGGWPQWTMHILEEYPTNTKGELQKHERFLIESMNANLNSSLPSTKKLKYKEL